MSRILTVFVSLVVIGSISGCAMPSMIPQGYDFEPNSDKGVLLFSTEVDNLNCRVSNVLIHTFEEHAKAGFFKQEGIQAYPLAGNPLLKYTFEEEQGYLYSRIVKNGSFNVGWLHATNAFITLMPGHYDDTDLMSEEFDVVAKKINYLGTLHLDVRDCDNVRIIWSFENRERDIEDFLKSQGPLSKYEVSDIEVVMKK